MENLFSKFMQMKFNLNTFFMSFEFELHDCYENGILNTNVHKL